MDLPLVRQLRQLRDKSLADRPTRLLLVAREAWHALAREQDGAVAHALITLLQDPDDLGVVRMVLPEMRSGADPPPHALQRKVVEETAHPRALLGEGERTQRHFDQPDYLEEKEILQRAEMHRLCLLLYGNEFLTDQEVLQAQRWLDECPLAPCDGDAFHAPSERPPDVGQRDPLAIERLALREADVHVLRLLLFSSRTLTQREQDAVLAWLEACPMQAPE